MFSLRNGTVANMTEEEAARTVRLSGLAVSFTESDVSALFILSIFINLDSI